MADRHITARKKVIKYYGGKCSCCDESRYEFLSIDHIGGNGSRHRREENITNIAYWIIKNNYPDGFRVLCHNCNFSLGHYGYCPHGNIRIEKDQSIYIKDMKEYSLEMF